MLWDRIRAVSTSFVQVKIRVCDFIFGLLKGRVFLRIQVGEAECAGFSQGHVDIWWSMAQIRGQLFCSQLIQIFLLA